jgi:O-antigen/teichoic acid export membrane protein
MTVARRRTRSVLVGSASMLAARLLSVVVSFVSVGVLTRQLGRDEFGLWSVIGVFVGFAGSFDFGLGQGMRNRLTILAAQGKASQREEQELFFSVLAFLAVLALVSAVLLGSLSLLTPWAGVLGVTSPALIGPAHAATTAVIVLLLLNLPLTLNLAGFLAYQEAAQRSIFDAFQSLALLLGVVLFARVLPIAQFIATYYVLFDLAALIALVAFLRRRGWGFVRVPRQVVLTHIRAVAKSSLLFWLLGTAAITIFTADPLIAAKVSGIGRAGEFSVLQKLVVLLITVHFTVLTPLWSAYTHAAATHDWLWIRLALKRSVLITVALFGLGGLFVVWLHGPLLHLWTGRNLSDPPLMTALVVWAILYAWINCFSVLLNGLNRIQQQVIVILISAALHVPLSIALGQRFGLVGVVWGSVLSLLPMAVSNPWQVYRLLALQAEGRNIL